MLAYIYDNVVNYTNSNKLQLTITTKSETKIHTIYPSNIIRHKPDVGLLTYSLYWSIFPGLMEIRQLCNSSILHDSSRLESKVYLGYRMCSNRVERIVNIKRNEWPKIIIAVDMWETDSDAALEYIKNNKLPLSS